MPDFRNIEYLRSGGKHQRLAYRALTEAGIMELLSDYDPILVGTIPINIDTDDSDLDIICDCYPPEQFTIDVVNRFSAYRGFGIISDIDPRDEMTRVVANFHTHGFEIEIYGASRPSEDQYAYRHMIIEHEILQMKGNGFREEVLKLKRQGVKTEPAFARLLGLPGDPYEAILEYGRDMFGE